MLKGIDVSRHNRFMKDLRAINHYDFVIIKATEGRSYRDQTLSLWVDALNDKTLKGFYHFCRADLNNRPEEEADNFLSYIGKYLPESPLLVIDVEGDNLRLSDIDRWVARWCEYVKEKVGYMPLIYTSEAYTRLFKKTASLDVGLWCAKWSKNKPKKIAPWKFFAIWQYTSNGICSAVRVDENYFNGTREQFLKYCGVMGDEAAENSRTTNDTTD